MEDDFGGNVAVEGEVLSENLEYHFLYHLLVFIITAYQHGMDVYMCMRLIKWESWGYRQDS